MRRTDEREALRSFADGTECEAQRAFGSLSVAARRFLHWHLIRRMPRPDDVEEVIQETLTRVWSMRSRFENRGVAAWYTLLRRTAENCRADWFRAGSNEVPLEDADCEAPADEELPLLDELLSALAVAHVSSNLQFAADTLWLGLDPAADEGQRARQLLAAQLYYLDGEPWERIVRLVAPGAGSLPPVERRTLDCWLEHPGVLRLLAYTQLFRCNDVLARDLLRLDETGGPEDLDRLMQWASGRLHEPPLEVPWTPQETRVILWRYRYGMLVEHILSRRDCVLTRTEISELSVRLAPLLPFAQEMQRLCQRLESSPQLSTEGLFGKPGLWQRLAFQYAYFESLSHADVGERLQPAAEVVDYQITPGMLNMWISGGRLIRRLARVLSAGPAGVDE